MTVRLHQPSKAKQLFMQVLELNSEAERAQYLGNACADDPDLRQLVDELFVAASRTSPLDKVTSDTKPAPQPFEDLKLKAIGPYTLMEKIGEGGMGVVYAAQQKMPIRRKVALKIIKAGMDTGQVIARFEAERQALAMMDHPSIAKVIDAGSTETGRPYFVMELIVGLTITDYCDQARMTTRQRLELFVDVCLAVQHAHQKGIIHRDLKPSNVMVTEIDGKPVAKVIDFGVAKATGEQLTERTFYTNVSQMIGTPLYMSPEQAGLTGVDVDTRSDVYSLGVLLYELLSGCTPFDREQMRGAGYEEIRRIIREEEPPRPSTRVDTLKAADSSTISERRGVDSRRLYQSVKGELDWIVMKALEKDRNRRYETSSSLAADVERYLNDEPVEACPPSTVYKFRKFARRNKVLLGTVSLVAAALILGIAGTAWQGIVASNERDRAIEAEQLAQTRLESEQKERARADQERIRAEKAEQLAKEEAATSKAINAFLNDDLLSQANPGNQPNPNVTLRAVIDQAAKNIEGQFAEQPIVEAAIRHTLAKTYEALGVYKEAQKHADRALQLRTQHLGADDANTIGTALLAAKLLNRQGDFQAARQQLEALLPRANRALGVEDPVTLMLMNFLADTHHNLGDYAAAERLFGKTLEIQRRALGDEHLVTIYNLNSLANVYRDQGRYDDAEELHLKTLEILRRTLGEEHPDTLNSMHNLASVYKDQRRYDEAEELYLQILEITRRIRGDEHPHTLISIHALTLVYKEQARFDEAEKLNLQTLEIQRRTLGDEHPSTLRSMDSLAVVYHYQSRYDEAEKLHLQTLEIKKRVLGNEHPDTLKSKNNLQGLSVNWCWKLATAADTEKRNPRKALELAHKAVELLPEAANGWQVLGWSHYRLGHWQETIDAETKSIELQRNDGDPWQWLFLAMAHWQLGEKEAARKYYAQSAASHANSKKEEVLRFFAEAEELMGLSAADRAIFASNYYTKRIEAEPDDWQAYNGRGKLFLQLEEWKQAAKDFESVIRLQPKYFPAHLDLIRACNHEGNFDRVIEVADTAVKLDATSRGLFHERGIAYYRKKEFELAIEDLSEAVRIDPKAQWSFCFRAMALKDRKQYDKALADIKAALKIQPDLKLAITLQAELNKLVGLNEETNSAEANQDQIETNDPKAGKE